MAQLVEDVDYYIEDGLYVFTAHYLLKRGYCCNCDCRHCPYPPGPAEDYSDLTATPPAQVPSNQPTGK
ncbi:MAG: hypothetical protein K1Y36_27335 [Blastocatellia bacterium]|nr:hypothetical protein [Blastocatellia bacterium]